MFSDRISKIERISVLSKLINKYCDEYTIVESVKLAKYLANIIDDLKRYKVNLDRFLEEFLTFFPDHWKKRTEFLKIVVYHWPKILESMGKIDVDINHKKNNIICTSKGLFEHFEYLKCDVNIFEASNMTEELEFIVDLVKSNNTKRIAIFVPTKKLVDSISIRFKFENIKYYSQFYTSIDLLNNTQQMSEYMSEIERCFDQNIDEISKELIDFVEPEFSEELVSILSINEANISEYDIAIVPFLNENTWGFVDNNEYWLHPMVRQNAGLPTFERLKSAIEDDFYSILKNDVAIYISASCGALKSPILAKFEAKCKKHNIPISKINYNKDYQEYMDIEHKELPSFDLPAELSARSIELLVNSYYAFFIKEILDIKPKYNLRYDAISIVRDVLFGFLSGNSVKLNDRLSELKSSYPEWYLKVRKVLAQLSVPKHSFCTNVLMKHNISDVGINISSYIDCINRDERSVVFFTAKKPPSAREILPPSNINRYLIALYLAKKNKEDVNTIEIWNISLKDKGPIEKQKIEVGEQIMMQLESDLMNSIRNHHVMQSNNKVYGVYRHYERRIQ